MVEDQAQLPADAPVMPPVVAPGYDFAGVTAKISDVVLERAITRGWLACLLVSALFVTVLTAAVTYLFLRGVGIWGINIPVAWGFAIANFVWWIGIGHAGTFISAILYLLRQEWRTSINRFAEAISPLNPMRRRTRPRRPTVEGSNEAIKSNRDDVVRRDALVGAAEWRRAGGESGCGIHADRQHRPQRAPQGR